MGFVVVIVEVVGIILAEVAVLEVVLAVAL